MRAPTDSKNGSSLGLAARSAKSRGARLANKVVARLVRPTTDELARRLDESAALLASLRSEHDVVAKDLHGLHTWLDMRFGMVEADPRFGELRIELMGKLEQVLDDIRTLDRHARKLLGVSPADVPAPASRGSETASPAGASLDGLFDYDAFENRFRGDPDRIFAEQIERYAHLVEGHAPVVDIGCGRGGFLAGLMDRGIQAIGVEPNPDLAAIARERGIETHEQYGNDYLASVPDNSLGAIVSFQVVEHLSVPDLIRLLDLAAEKLRPGGVFIAETPNPASWIVMHTSFILDPTHVRPLHPLLLTFLCERSGFSDVRVELFSPAVTNYLPMPPPEAGREVVAAIERLNDLLFGPQDYAVVARLAGGTS